PGTAYAYHAANGHASVRRVYVDDQNPRGPDTVDVYLAGDSGPVVSGIVDAVSDYLDGTTDGVDRIATTCDLEVHSAASKAVTVTASVYVIKQYNNVVTQAAISSAITEYFKALPIGGTRDADAGPGVVVIGELYKAILTVRGVQNVSFASPIADVSMNSSEVAVPTVSLTYYPV